MMRWTIAAAALAVMIAGPAMAQSADNRSMSDQSPGIQKDQGVATSPGSPAAGSPPDALTGAPGARPSDCVSADPRPSCEVAAMPAEEKSSGSSMGSGGISGGSGTGLQPQEGPGLSPRGTDLNPSAGSGG